MVEAPLQDLAMVWRMRPRQDVILPACQRSCSTRDRGCASGHGLHPPSECAYALPCVYMRGRNRGATYPPFKLTLEMDVLSYGTLSSRESEKVRKTSSHVCLVGDCMQCAELHAPDSWQLCRVAASLEVMEMNSRAQTGLRRLGMGYGVKRRTSGAGSA